MYFSPLMCLLLSKTYIFLLLLLLLSFERSIYFLSTKIRKIFIFAASIMSAPLTCEFDWLANLISSSIPIGSLNKHQLAQLLLTACNYYQLQSNSRQKYSKMFHISRKFGKNASVNSLFIIWSSFLFLTLNKLLTKPVLVIKALFYLFWQWFITHSYTLQKVLS